MNAPYRHVTASAPFATASGLSTTDSDEKIGTAEQHPYRRHQNIIHDRRYHLSESTADDNADSHVDHIAFQSEGLEFLKYLTHIYCMIL